MATTGPIDPSLARVLDAYRDAVFAKDVDAFTALYDPAVRVFDLWGAWSYEGLDAWRGMVDGWFGSLGSTRVVVAFDDVRAETGDGLAVVHAFVTYSDMDAEGKSSKGMRNRLSWTLAARGDGWSVIHEHTSAPVDPGTGKVILQVASQG